MLKDLLVYMLVPLVVFTVGFFIVMWPGVLLVYRGTEKLRSRKGKKPTTTESVLILLGFLWIQFFLSGWAFYVAARVCINIHTGIGAGVLCYVTGFFLTLAPTTVLLAATDLRTLPIVSCIVLSGLTYVVTLLRTDITEKVYGWVLG